MFYRNFREVPEFSCRAFPLICAILFTLSPILAEGGQDAFQYVKLNTTSDVALYNEIHSEGDVNSYNYIAADGSVEVFINGENINEKSELALTETALMAEYIGSRESEWLKDSSGIGIYEVARAFERIINYRAGETNYLPETDRLLMNYIGILTYSDARDYFEKNIGERDSALDAFYEAIQKNSYEIEALYRTLEKSDPDTYCKSRIEVAEKYGLASVKCGLHSKICYNGELNLQEGGRDFCVHTDDDKDYIPCHNTLGNCGRLNEIFVLESEENSYIPIIFRFENPGTIALSPSIKVDLQKIDSNIVLKSYKEELFELLSGEEKTYRVYLDTSGIEPGRYELWISINSGRKEIIERQFYVIQKEGSIERQGDFYFEAIGPKEDGSVILKGDYLNSGDLPYNVRLDFSFYLNGEKIAQALSNPVYVKPGEVQALEFAYLGEDFGEYEIVAGVLGTDFKKSASFSRVEENQEAKRGYLNGSIASATAYILIMVILALSAILAVNYFRTPSLSRHELELRRELV
jgi:hypothetical protein